MKTSTVFGRLALLSVAIGMAPTPGWAANVFETLRDPEQDTTDPLRYRKEVFSSDGRILVTFRGDRVSLWEAATGKLRANLKAEACYVRSVHISPDSTTVASLSMNGALTLWDVATAEVRLNIARDMTEKGWANLGPLHGGWSPDGARLAWISSVGSLRVLDVRSRKEQSLEGSPAGGITSVAWAPDGKTLVIVSQYKTLGIWDMASGKETASLDPSADVVWAMFSPDGRSLVSNGRGGVMLWDVATAKRRAVLEKSYSDAAFSSDSRTLVTAYYQQPLRLWDVATGREKALLEETFEGKSFPVRFSPDGSTLASANWKGIVKLWNVATGKEKATLKGHPRSETLNETGLEMLYLLGFSPDGKTLATRSNYQRLQLWETATGKERATLQELPEGVGPLHFNPDGKTLVACGSVKLRVWALPACQPLEADPPKGNDPKVLEENPRLWETLTEEDPQGANAAAVLLLKSPRQAVLLLKEKLQPAREPQAQEIAGWIADLGVDRSGRRQEATEKLHANVEAAEGALREELKQKPPLEVQLRIEQILSKIGHPTREDLRHLRATEVLERIGNSEAKEILERLSQGANRALITREAKASLERLNTIQGR